LVAKWIKVWNSKSVLTGLAVQISDNRIVNQWYMSI
jgi:hypothetical protein